MKFATKIFVYVFFSTAIIIFGMAMITHYWISNHHIENCINHSKELAMLIALKSEDYVLRNDRIELYQFYQSILQVDPYVEYIFAERQANVLVHTFSKGVPKGLLQLEPVTNPSHVYICPVVNSAGEVIYHFRIDMSVPAHTTLHIGVSSKRIQATLIEHKHILILVGFVLLATVPFGLALFLSRLVSKPINTLRNGVRRIGGGELDYRLDLPTGDELEQLTDDINTMAEKLEKLTDGLKAEISERVQAEAVLAQQTELLDHILTNVPHNVFWKDSQSVYSGCNKAFARVAGFNDPAEVVGKSDFDLPWKDNGALFLRECDRKVFDSGEPLHDIENTLTQADGKEIDAIFSIVPLRDRDGSISGALGIYYDITERKRMEETVKQTQKMEAIGTLAGGIAHDFNNILGGIIGYTELAEGELDRGCNAYYYLQDVLKSASRAKELVRQILTFSRKSQEERKPIQLAVIVREEAKMLRSTLPATIEIRQEISDAEGMVNADPTQLHQIVMNLCTNAAHAMVGGEGLLTIALSSIIVTAKDSSSKYRGISPGPYMNLKISDTGSGIDSRILHRIFEPFFTTKEKEKGTGMGLAVVHGIVKDYGGDVAVESIPGKGTSFTVLLPRVIAKPDTAGEATCIVPTGQERILFIDDEKVLLRLGEKLLGSLGYQVTAINGSLEALDVYRSSPDAFDLIITDQTMPHMTGFNLAGRILEINPCACILLCTGYSDTITPEKVEAAGIKSLLYKPMSRNQLATAIRQALDLDR